MTTANTLPLSNITQYDKMVEFVGKNGVRVGVIIWFQKHDECVYVPIKSVKQHLENGKKSINIKEVRDGGIDCLIIPSKKKRVFLDCDYSCMLEL